MSIFDYFSFTSVLSKPVIIATGLIAIYLMQTIAYLGIFKKAGEKPWKAFVPGINGYAQFKISWTGFAFIVYLLVFALQFIPQIFSANYPDLLDTQYAGYVSMGASVVLLIMQIVACIKLSRCFGHKLGWAIGLLLLTQVFMLAIGLGNSEYVGKNVLKKDKKPKTKEKKKKEKKTDEYDNPEEIEKAIENLEEMKEVKVSDGKE